MQAQLESSGSRRRFSTHDLGQDLLLICKSPDEIRNINHVTGLRFRDLKM